MSKLGVSASDAARAACCLALRAVRVLRDLWLNTEKVLLKFQKKTGSDETCLRALEGATASWEAATAHFASSMGS